MKKFHVTRKTVLTIVGVTLPLTAAAILLPRLKRSRRPDRSGRNARTFRPNMKSRRKCQYEFFENRHRGRCNLHPALLLICFGLTPLSTRASARKTENRAGSPAIRAGDEITESMVQIVEVGGYNLPEDVLRQKESAVGK